MWYRLRVSIVAMNDRAGDLSFEGGACTVYKVASDGVWHQRPFNTWGGYSGNRPHFGLTGASRADFAIKCAFGSNTEVRWNNDRVAMIYAGNYGTGGGMAGGLAALGSAPPTTGALSAEAIRSANVPSANRRRFSVSINSINNRAWNPNSGLGVRFCCYNPIPRVGSHASQILVSNSHMLILICHFHVSP